MWLKKKIQILLSKNKGIQTKKNSFRIYGNIPQRIPDLQPRVPYQGIFQEEPELEIGGID